MKILGYETHPAADLFRMLEGEEAAALAASIKASGLLTPVVLLDGKILDGRNRARACEQLGIPIKTVEYKAKLDPWEFVWDVNAERRHLAPGEKAVAWVRKEAARTSASVKAEANKKRSEKAKGNRYAVRDSDFCKFCGSKKFNGDCTDCGGPNGAGSRDPAPSRDRGGSKTALAGAGQTRVSPATIKRAQELFKKAPAKFAEVAEGKAELNKSLREVKRAEKHAEIAEQSRAMPAIGKVRPCPVVYADPPWQYGNTASTSAAEDHYPTMPLADICALDIPATKDAVLFLWATSPLLPEAMEVIRAWGFTYKGSMVWDKGSGTGNWVLNAHELLLIAVRGDIPCPAPPNRPVSVIRSPIGRHSAKPAAFAEAIERMFPGLPKIEMFARASRDGWAVWGNQAA